MSVIIRYAFLSFCVLFLLFSFSVYIKPSYRQGETRFNTVQAASGRLIWQKYNCQTCHQLYGLGGYLGPDITNIYSAPGKGKEYILAMLMAGIKQMPSFKMSESESNDLLEFLKSVDLSGKSDPRIFSANPFGMIEINENK